MSAPLRRSRRGQKQAYGPGDKVEVVRDDGVAIGRLVRVVVDSTLKDVDDSPSSNNNNVVHWIVSFEGDTEEHEVTEKYIGRLVESTDSDSVKSTPPGGETTSSAGISSIKGNSNHNTTKGTVSHGANSTTKVRNSRLSPPRHTKSASVEKATALPAAAAVFGTGEARPSTRSTIRQKGGKEKALVKGIKVTTKKAAAGRGAKSPKISSGESNKNETVVKVKMLTGTLYLYRGEKRRAEFIRTV